MRIVRVDGSPAAVGALAAAVADALDGGPAVLPLAAGAPVPAALGGARVEPGNVLVATSGSTGEPRLVVLSAAALRASATATEGRLGGPARWLLALPADHVAGLQVIVRALLAGAARGAPSGVPAGPAAVDLRPGFRPAAFAAAAAALGDGPRCTSLVPTQLRRLLDDGGAPLDALRACTAVLVGGAALDPGLRARAEAAGVRVVTTYGMTETAGGCVYDGVPLDGVRVHLDGDGRITLGGPTLAAGYLGHPPDPAPAPDAGLGGAASGAAGPGAAGRGAAGSGPAGSGPAGFGTDADGRRCFRTSDLGRWVDGRLEVLGRADDVIVTGGEKVAPAAVERVLAAQPGVRAACVVGLPDAEWGAVVAAAVERDPAGHGPTGDPAADTADDTGAGDPERWRAAVRAALGRAAVPRVLHEVDALPLRGIGKPDRDAVARLLAGRVAVRPQR